MRYLLALLIMLPGLAQEPAKPPAEPKAEEAKPAAEAKAQEKKAESPVPSAEEWLSGSLDVGYRWITDIKGSSDAYRSVVNLGEGPKLLGADITIQDPKRRAFDRIDARALGWGGDPYNTAHIDARKMGVYDLRFDYRNIAYFNALPSYANPFLAQGGLLSDHRFDTHRRMSTVDLELMPGGRIIPYFVYSRDGGRGRGVTTFVSDANEYAVPMQVDDHTDNYRGGVRLEHNRWHVTLEEGATRYSDQQRVFNSIRTLGDRLTPVSGQTLSLTNLNQQYDISSEGSYTKVLVTTSPAAWANFYGQFLYSQPKTDVRYTDSAAGNLVVLSSLLFYTGQTDLATGVSKAPHTSGSLGFELRPIRRLRIIESLSLDRMHNAGFGVLAETLLFSGRSQALTPEALNTRQVLNFNRQQIDALVDVTSRITVRGGHRYEWGNAVDRAPQLSQSGLLESGELRRQVGLAGISFRTTSKLSFNADYEAGSSDRDYFRTSLHDYQKLRARARYQMLGSLALQASASLLSNQNPSREVKYDFLSRDTSLTAYWTPAGGKRVSVTADYSRSTLRSDIQFLVPQALNTPERSFYRDNAHTATALADIMLPGYSGLTPRLTLGGSLLNTAGSRPSHYYQPLFRLSLPFQKHVYWNTEWRWFGFGETFYGYEGFRAHAFTTGLRLTK